MKVDSFRGEVDKKNISMLTNGEVWYKFYQRDPERLGSFLDGSCFKGTSHMVKAIQEELERCGIQYKFPSSFLHKGRYNRYTDTIYVETVEPTNEKVYEVHGDDYLWSDSLLTLSHQKDS